MREFAKVSPQIWIDENGRKIKKLGVESQLVSLYLLTNPHANMIGVYYLPVTLMAHEVGLSVDVVTSSLMNLCKIGYCSYDHEAEFIWVHEMALSQIASTLKAKDHRVKGVNELFLGLPSLSFLEYFYQKYAGVFFLESHRSLVDPLQGALKPLVSKEKEKERENDNETDNDNEKKEKNIFIENSENEKLQLDGSYAQATEVLMFLNEFANKTFEPTPENLQHIIERIKQGETVEVCRAVIVRKSRQWLNDLKMDRSLNPVTLFKKDNYFRYKGELVAPKESVTNESK